jgi:Ca2+-binding RTX toxin-like protein
LCQFGNDRSVATAFRPSRWGDLMKIKAGKDFKNTVFVEVGEDEFVSFSSFIKDYKYVNIQTYDRVTLWGADLYEKVGGGEFRLLEPETDLKVDLGGSKLGIWGSLGSGDDFVRMGNGGCSIVLGEGRNVFRGGEGKDGIEGGSQADTIHGAGGNDVIRGGGGKDVLSGGKGKDFFTFESFDTFDTRITDFKVGEDMVALNGWSASDLEIKNTKDGAVIRHVENDESEILLEGVSKAELSDFDQWLS